MPGKSLIMHSASCHSHQKGLKKPKMFKINFENSFTFDTFKLFLPKNDYAFLHIIL
jgi:hypothetical protein